MVQNTCKKSFYDAVSAFSDDISEYAATNPEDAERVARLYESYYNASADGPETVWGRFSLTPTKADIVSDYRCYVQSRLHKWPF